MSNLPWDKVAKALGLVAALLAIGSMIVLPVRACGTVQGNTADSNERLERIERDLEELQLHIAELIVMAQEINSRQPEDVERIESTLEELEEGQSDIEEQVAHLLFPLGRLDRALQQLDR